LIPTVNHAFILQIKPHQMWAKTSEVYSEEREFGPAIFHSGRWFCYSTFQFSNVTKMYRYFTWHL